MHIFSWTQLGGHILPMGSAAGPLSSHGVSWGATFFPWGRAGPYSSHDPETDRDKSEWVGSSLNGLDRLEWYKLVKRYGAHQYALGQAVIEKVSQNGIALLHFLLHLINPKTQKMVTLVKVDY